MFKKLAPYNKLIVALLGAVITVVVQYYGKNQVVQLAVSLLTALGVYVAPNKASV
jgi:FtsH-binding integral membrane protein